MATQCFKTKSIAALKQYLKDRGVVFSDQRKPALVKLCENASELEIEVDPDGLVEDRAEVIRQKLCFADVCLRCPDSISGTCSLSCVANLSIFDIYNYLLKFRDYDHATLRAYHQMEGYTMFKDGYVTKIEAVSYRNTGNKISILVYVVYFNTDLSNRSLLQY